MEIVPFESKIYHETRTLRVLVPANYFSPHNTHRSYPVLYMQDGQNLFDEATSHSGEWHMDETVEHLVVASKFRRCSWSASIMRRQAQLRVSAVSDAHNDKGGVADEKSVHGTEYARFVITEVMPFIEKRYRVAAGAMNTGIGGSSYGAVIALYTGLEYPGTFGHLLVESPPLWIAMISC